MCCLIAVLALLGPRVGIVLWWLADQRRWDSAWDTFIVPFIGFLFLPWTTLMFVAVAPFGNVAGWDWLWLALALLVDLSSYGGGGYGNRSRIPGYGRR
ncbi:MAG: hypothetical protein AB7R89_18285 [Dehalococcoidia bacterium]